MKSTTRVKAYRSILSALLTSNLSASELHEVASGLRNDNEFLAEVGNALEESAKLLCKYSDDSDKIRETQQAGWLRDMKSLIKKKRVAKQEVLSRVVLNYPGIPADYLHGGRTLNEILGYVGKNAPAAVLDDLRTWLASDSAPADEYLAGIMKR